MHGKNTQQLIFYLFTHSFHVHAGKKYAYCQPSVVTAVTMAVTRIHFQDKLRSWYHIRSNEGLRERTEYVLQL